MAIPAEVVVDMADTLGDVRTCLPKASVDIGRMAGMFTKYYVPKENVA